MGSAFEDDGSGRELEEKQLVADMVRGAMAVAQIKVGTVTITRISEAVPASLSRSSLTSPAFSSHSGTCWPAWFAALHLADRKAFVAADPWKFLYRVSAYLHYVHNSLFVCLGVFVCVCACVCQPVSVSVHVCVGMHGRRRRGYDKEDRDDGQDQNSS